MPEEPAAESTALAELRPMEAGHADLVLAFELANRDWFTASISDRGDDFFHRYAVHHRAALAEQEAGTAAYYLLLGADGAVLGRFNLYRIGDRSADLGYRVAQHAAGGGVATAAVRDLCRLAAGQGLRTLRAVTSEANAASRKVLVKNGFTVVGPAHAGGKPGLLFQRDLTDQEDPGTFKTGFPVRVESRSRNQ